MISPLNRILVVMEFYASRGINSERVNKVYRKIINEAKSNSNK